LVLILQLSQWCTVQHTSNRKERYLFGGFQPSPACPSDKSSPMMKLSIEHWRIDADRQKQMYFDTKPVLLSLCTTQISCWSARCFIQPTNVQHASRAPRCDHSRYRLNLLIYFVIRKLAEKRREFNLETNKFCSLNWIFVQENNNELFAISFN